MTFVSFSVLRESFSSGTYSALLKSLKTYFPRCSMANITVKRDASTLNTKGNFPVTGFALAGEPRNSRNGHLHGAHFLFQSACIAFTQVFHDFTPHFVSRHLAFVPNSRKSIYRPILPSQQKKFATQFELLTPFPKWHTKAAIHFTSERSQHQKVDQRKKQNSQQRNQSTRVTSN